MPPRRRNRSPSPPPRRQLPNYYSSFARYFPKTYSFVRSSKPLSKLHNIQRRLRGKPTNREMITRSWSRYFNEQRRMRDNENRRRMNENARNRAAASQRTAQRTAAQRRRSAELRAETRLRHNILMAEQRAAANWNRFLREARLQRQAAPPPPPPPPPQRQPLPSIAMNNNNMRQNVISYRNFNPGNIAYVVYRNRRGHGQKFALEANTLKEFIQRHHGREINNLNAFLRNVNNNAVLFRDPITRQNRKKRNITKAVLVSSN